MLKVVGVGFVMGGFLGLVVWFGCGGVSVLVYCLVYLMGDANCLGFALTGWDF